MRALLTSAAAAAWRVELYVRNQQVAKNEQESGRMQRLIAAIKRRRGRTESGAKKESGLVKLATKLYEVCALSRAGIVGGWFDGPRAWQILLERIEGDGERSEYDTTLRAQ